MTSTITDRVYGESASVAVKAPCVAVALTPLPLSGLGAVGGYTPNEGDRILVIGQTDPTTNGIYDADTGPWARSGDFDGIYDAVQGTLVVVVYSNAAATIYQLTTVNPVIGTTPLNFSSFINPNTIYPTTPAEAAMGVPIVNSGYLPGQTLRYGIVPNLPGAAAANTAALRQLVSYALNETGWTGTLEFNNITGGDSYYFNDFVDFREGIHVDLQGCTYQFTKTAPTGNEDNSGAIMAIRDFVLENGTLNFNFPTAGGTGCAALFLGARGVEGTYYVPMYDSVYLANTGRTMGNIAIRNMYITSNAPGQRCIEHVGGLQNVIFENVWEDGQGVADGSYGEYGFATDGGGVQSARQSSHPTNWRWVNFKATDLLSTGSGIAVNGGYNMVIDGLRVLGGGSVCGFGFGEAYYFDPWSFQDGSESTRRTVTIRDVIGKNFAASGITIQGANASSVASGYLASVINALSTPALYEAQSDLVGATIEDFALLGTSAGNGIQVIGADRLDIRNGSLTGFNIGINCTTEVTRYGIRGVEILNSAGAQGTGIAIGNGSAVWSPPRLSVGEISECFIAGSENNAIELQYTSVCKIVANRFAYNLAHDGIAETTQDAAVNVAATATGVICDSNYVAAVTTGDAYAMAGAVSGGNTVLNASGVTDASGLWENLLNSISPDRGDVSFTYTPHADFRIQRFATALTANRTMPLGTVGANIGDTVRTVRTGLGAFTLTVNGSTVLPASASAWCEHVFNGSAWTEIGAGTPLL